MFWKRKPKTPDVETILTNKIIDRILAEGCSRQNTRPVVRDAYILCEWFSDDIHIILGEYGRETFSPAATLTISGQDIDLTFEHCKAIGEVLYREWHKMYTEQLVADRAERRNRFQRALDKLIGS